MSYYNPSQYPNQNGNYIINPALAYGNPNPNYTTQLTAQFPGQSPASLLQLLQSTQMQAAQLMNMNVHSQPQMYQQPMSYNQPQESCALCGTPITNERIFLEFDNSQNKNFYACSNVCKNLWFARTGRIPDANEPREEKNSNGGPPKKKQKTVKEKKKMEPEKQTLHSKSISNGRTGFTPPRSPEKETGTLVFFFLRSFRFFPRRISFHQTICT